VNDIDGSNVTNITNWFVNNASITVLNMPFDTNISVNNTDAIRDYSPRQNNGTGGEGNASLIPEWKTGPDCIRGGCYFFNGSYKKIKIDHDESIALRQNFSIAFWFKPMGTPASSSTAIFSKEGSTQNYYAEYYDNGNLAFWLINTSVVGYNCVVVPPLNAWSFIVMTFNSTTITCYLNGTQGQQNNPGVVTVQNGGNKILVGGTGLGGFVGMPLNGTLDELIFFNRTLSADQVRLMYLTNSSMSVLHSSETTKSESWYVNVTPNDGVVDGTTVMSNTLIIGNWTPTIVNISDIGSQIINEAGAKNLTFAVIVEDNDTTSDITNVNFTISLSGATTRSNTSCRLNGTLSSYRANYSCTVELWYFDAPGFWSANATAKDIDNKVSPNFNVTFQVQQTSAIVLGPLNITWTQLAPGNVNATALVNITLNNTGNKNITPGNISINGTDVRGVTTPSLYIPAANFSLGPTGAGTDECSTDTRANATINNTDVRIAGANLTRGNFSLADAITGQEVLYLCIREVPTTVGGQALTSQRYATTRDWVVTVS